MRSGSAIRYSTSSEVGVRVGIFGGTFDPVHQGHMIVAEQVMTELDMARVVFVPGGIPPHKEASSVRANATDRLAMVEAAVEGNERFSVDRVEIDAGRPMHSVETVRILRESAPENDWYFITGADEVSNLLAWKEPDRLLEQVVMIGYLFTDVAKLDLEAHVPHITAFWETVLLGAQTYSGGAFRPHAELPTPRRRTWTR